MVKRCLNFFFFWITSIGKKDSAFSKAFGFVVCVQKRKTDEYFMFCYK